jgi:hypothetical protein
VNRAFEPPPATLVESASTPNPSLMPSSPSLSLRSLFQRAAARAGLQHDRGVISGLTEGARGAHVATRSHDNARPADRRRDGDGRRGRRARHGHTVLPRRAGRARRAGGGLPRSFRCPRTRSIRIAGSRRTCTWPPRAPGRSRRLPPARRE